MNISDKYNLDLLHNEQKINELLKDIDLIEPPKTFIKFINYKFNENNNQTLEKFNSLDFLEQKKLREEFDNINYEFEKNLILIKLFIFKGCVERTNYKPTEFDLFKDFYLINLYENKKIRYCSTQKNEIKLKFNEDNIFKEKIKQIKINNDILLDLSYKYKTDDNFKYFVLKNFSHYKKCHKSYPLDNDLIKKWENLTEEEKKNYLLFKPSYKNEYVYQDIFDLIHSIEPIPPIYPAEIFFEERKKENMDNQKAFILYQKITKEKKEKYNLLYNRRFLAYKYKLIQYNKFNHKYKIKKPGGYIQIYMKEYNMNIPKNNNNLEFLNNEYNKLDIKTKEHYYKKSIEELKNYQNTLNSLDNIETKLPIKPFSNLNDE